MIPDKIYIPIIEEDGKKLLCTNWWEVDTSPQNAYVNETIPYIRKEALLEWAVYMRDKNPFGTYEYSMFQHMIDKLNEM